SGAGGSGGSAVWEEQCTAAPCANTRPAARQAVNGAFDPIRNQLVIFGGYTDAATAADTLAWDGAGWSLPCNSASCHGVLDGRGGAGLVSDAVRGEIVLFGGLASSTCKGGPYAWNGSAWSAIAAGTPAPVPRFSFGFAFDPIRGKTVLFSGSNCGTPAADTYEL